MRRGPRRPLRTPAVAADPPLRRRRLVERRPLAGTHGAVRGVRRRPRAGVDGAADSLPGLRGMATRHRRRVARTDGVLDSRAGRQDVAAAGAGRPSASGAADISWRHGAADAAGGRAPGGQSHRTRRGLHPLHDAAGRLAVAAVPLHRRDRLLRRRAGGRPDPRRTRAAHRHVRQHAGPARGPSWKPELSRRPAPRAPDGPRGLRAPGRPVRAGGRGAAARPQPCHLAGVPADVPAAQLHARGAAPGRTRRRRPGHRRRDRPGRSPRSRRWIRPTGCAAR